MKAPVFMGVGKPLEIHDLPDPEPSDGELILKVGRCGICGSDLHMTEGYHDLLMPSGTVMGHEFAGEVVAKGLNTDGFKIGDHVLSIPTTGCGKCRSCLAGEFQWCPEFTPIQGGYAQYARVKAHASILMPSTLSMADGALCEPLAVGLHGVSLAQSAPGSRCLVLGLGAIGLAAVYWARQSGAKVMAAAPSRRAESLAMGLGANSFAVLDENIKDEIKKNLGGPPDVVYECTGVGGMIARGVDLVANRGTVLVLGACMGSDSFNPWPALVKEVKIQFSVVYSLGEVQAAADALNSDAVGPRLMITDTVGYRELPEAFEALRTPSKQCKVMINPWQE